MFASSISGFVGRGEHTVKVGNTRSIEERYVC